MLAHFEGMGFLCPPRKDPGSFLQARGGACNRKSGAAAPPASRAPPCREPQLPCSGNPPRPQEVTTPAGQWLYASKELLAQHDLCGGWRGCEAAPHWLLRRHAACLPCTRAAHGPLRAPPRRRGPSARGAAGPPAHRPAHVGRGDWAGVLGGVGHGARHAARAGARACAAQRGGHGGGADRAVWEQVCGAAKRAGCGARLCSALPQRHRGCSRCLPPSPAVPPRPRPPLPRALAPQRQAAGARGGAAPVPAQLAHASILHRWALGPLGVDRSPVAGVPPLSGGCGQGKRAALRELPRPRPSAPPAARVAPPVLQRAWCRP